MEYFLKEFRRGQGLWMLEPEETDKHTFLRCTITQEDENMSTTDYKGKNFEWYDESKKSENRVILSLRSRSRS